MRTKRVLAALLVLVMIFTAVLTACGEKKCKHKETTTENKKEATCATKGYTGDKVCKKCGETVSKGKETDIAEGKHSFDEGTVTKEATCVEEGVKTQTCKYCHITKTETIEVSEKCNNEYHYESNSHHTVVCKDCHTSSNGKHTQGELLEEKDASCEESAYKMYECKDCGNAYKEYDDKKAALGHDWDDENPVTVEPTCTTPGTKYIQCSRSGCTERSAEVTLPAVSSFHDYEEEVTVEATCTQTGTKALTCKECGAKEFKTIQKVPHNYGKATTQGDLTVKTCDDCGYKLSTINASDKEEADVDASNISSDNALKVELSNAGIEFPAELVEEMKNNGNVTVGASVANKDDIISQGSMSEEDKDALKADNAKIYDFSVGGISSDFNKPVTVTLDYTLGKNEDPEGIVIWYVDYAGEITAIDNVAFHDEDGDGKGTVTFEVDHFSHYAIAYKETPEMKCRRGNHSYTDTDLWEIVEASCAWHGYTRKDCAVCGYVDVTNYTKPTGHDWDGVKTQPKITCEAGGYVHETCTKCGAHKDYEYIPSKGHTPVGHATCTTSVSCSDCKQIFVPAYGHNWSEWETVVEATADNKGLKRRHCPRCGEVKTITSSAASDVKAWEYDSPSALLQLVIEEFIEIDQGTVSFIFNNEVKDGEETQTVDYKLDITVDKTADSCNAYIKATNGTYEESEVYEVYYLDGKVFSIDNDGTTIMDIDKLIPIPFDNILNEAQLYINAVDEIIGSGYLTANQAVEMIVNAYGKELNEALKESGTSFTAETLLDAIECLRTFYTYYAAKLGIETAVELPEKPSADAMHSILSTFMKKTEADGKTTYSYDVSEYNDALNALLDTIEDKYDMACSDVIYDIFGGIIKKTLPEATSWDAFISVLKKEFSGTTQVKALVDKLTTVLEGNDKYDIDALYAQIENIAEIAGYELDIKTAINTFSENTFDAFVAGMGKDENGDPLTASKLYDNFSEMLKGMKFGEIVMSEERAPIYDNNGKPVYGANGEIQYEETKITLKDSIDSYREMLSSVSQSGVMEITFSKDNKFAGAKVEVNQTSEGMYNTEETITTHYTLSVKADKNATVTVPNAIKDYVSADIKSEYDKDGNLNISGIPSGFNGTLEFEGDINVSLDNFTTLDKELSATVGFDVYVLDKALWHSENIDHVAVSTDGKLYELESVYSNYTITEKTPIFDVFNNPENYLPEDGAETSLYMRPNGRDSAKTALYTTPVGYVYEESGTWYLIDQNKSHKEYTSYEDGYDIIIYNNVVSYPYTATVKSMKISNTNSYYEHYFDAEANSVIQAAEVYVSFDGSDTNMALKAIFEKGNIYLLTLVENHSSRYIIGEEISSGYDYYEVSDWNENYVFFDENYNEVTGYKYAYTYKKVPTYYTKYDGYYFSLPGKFQTSSYQPFVSADIEGLDTDTLTDGRTIYIVKQEGDKDSFAEIYGYVKVTEGRYVQTYVKYENGKAVSTLYRNNASEYYSNSTAVKHHSIYEDDVITAMLSKYVTKNSDGSFKVSAEGIKFIKSICTEEQDSVYISVYGKKEADGKTITIGANVPVLYNPLKDTPSLFDNSTYIEWGDIFYSDGNNGDSIITSDVIINKNPDGSITITDRNSNRDTVDLGFSFNESISSELTELLQKDNAASLKAGVDVYSVTGRFAEYGSFAYYGGGYYRFDEYINILRTHYVTDYTKVTLNDYITKDYHLGDIDYKYDADDGGRVYQARVYFANSGMKVYLKIKDSKIYVLTGITTDTSSLLEYESEVTFEDFIKSLTIESELNNSKTNYYLANGTPIYSTNIRVSSADNSASPSCYYYLQNNNPVYITFDSYNTETEYRSNFSISDRITLPSSWIERDREIRTYGSVKIEIVTGHYLAEETAQYVKIGDNFISYDTYRYYSCNKNDFLNNLGEKIYIYGVSTGNGYEYYESFSYEDGYIALSGRLTNVGSDLRNDGYIGDTADGNSVYNFIMWSTDHLDTLTLSDGTVVYYNTNASDNAYAKLNDTTYYRGHIVNGSYVPYKNNYEDKLSDVAVAGAIGLYDCIERNGYSVTVSPEILDIISKYEQYIENIYVITDGYDGHTMDISTFREYFR